MSVAVRHVWPLWKQPTIMSPDHLRLVLVGGPAVSTIPSLLLCIFQMRRVWISQAVQMCATIFRREKQRARKLMEH